jgi:CRISPR-associated Csx2 family protein
MATLKSRSRNRRVKEQGKKDSKKDGKGGGKMARVLISFLGTNKYVECRYGVRKKSGLSTKAAQSNHVKQENDGYWLEKPVRFVQEALARIVCNDWSPGDRIVVFTTQRAAKQNWLRSFEYGDWNEKNSLPGLKSVLEEATQGSGIHVCNNNIPEGFDEKEVWAQFENVLSLIEKKDEVHLDITHAFRSIPMLAFTVMEHARSLKQARVGGIYYGAFESLGPAKKVSEMPVDRRKSPLLNLTPLWTSQRWSVSMNSFVRYGQTAGLIELLDEEIHTHKPKGAGDPIIEARNQLKDFRNYLDLFGQAHLLASIPAIVGLPVDSLGFKRLFDSSDSILPAPLAKPLVDDFQRAHKSYESTAGRRLLAAIHWCVEHGLHPQAMTLTREALDTAACVEVGIHDWWDKNNGRKKASSAVTALEKSARNKEMDSPRPTVVDEDVFKKLEQQWADQDIDLLNTLVQQRNHLNHAGLRDPDQARKLSSTRWWGLRSKKDKLKQTISKHEQTISNLLRSRMLAILEEWDDQQTSETARDQAGRADSEKTEKDEQKKKTNRLYNLTNHELTSEQITQARDTLGMHEIVSPPEELRKKLADIPPDETDVAKHISALAGWLRDEKAAGPGDVVLVQGEHGATYALVDFAFRLGAIPMHATTERTAKEVRAEDGSVTTKRTFRHVQFRPYSRIC